MLPGFRFLFAAILLSTSILVFGLGAAALLRATHEQFVSNPSWRNGPQEQVFAQASEPPQPVLATLRTEPLPPSTSVRDEVPTIGLPESGPEQAAALTSEVSSAPVVPVAGEAPATEAPSPPAEAPVTQTASAEPAPPVTDPLAIIEAAPTPATVVEPQQAGATVPPPSEGTREVAALADPATAAPQDPPTKAKAASDTSDKQAAKRRANKKRQRIVRRPLPLPVQVQQIFSPFATQPLQQYRQPAYAATTRAR
ncbi:hypothetical protein Q3C01_23210 [Bradyrhizobium sp. UFLA05-109]